MPQEIREEQDRERAKVAIPAEDMQDPPRVKRVLTAHGRVTGLELENVTRASRHQGRLAVDNALHF